MDMQLQDLLQGMTDESITKCRVEPMEGGGFRYTALSDAAVRALQMANAGKRPQAAISIDEEEETDPAVAHEPALKRIALPSMSVTVAAAPTGSVGVSFSLPRAPAAASWTDADPTPSARRPPPPSAAVVFRGGVSQALGHAQVPPGPSGRVDDPITFDDD